LVLPAAGLPTSRGGNAFAVRALHFFATSALIAHALSVIGAPIAKASKAKALANLRFLDILLDTPKEARANVLRWTNLQRIEDEKVLDSRLR
jgi:hypothetical protein